MVEWYSGSTAELVMNAVCGGAGRAQGGRIAARKFERSTGYEEAPSFGERGGRREGRQEATQHVRATAFVHESGRVLARVERADRGAADRLEASCPADP